MHLPYSADWAAMNVCCQNKTMIFVSQNLHEKGAKFPVVKETVCCLSVHCTNMTPVKSAANQHRSSLWTSSLFGGRVKKSQGEGKEKVRACRQTFGTAIPPSCLVIANRLSARLLSVTWIHWNVINFACKKEVSTIGNTQLLPCAKVLLFFQWVFSLEGRLCSGGFSFSWENVIFAAYFILRGCDTHIDFLRLLFLVWVICRLMQEHSLRLKECISQVPEDAMLKIRRPLY